MNTVFFRIRKVIFIVLTLCLVSIGTQTVNGQSGNVNTQDELQETKQRLSKALDALSAEQEVTKKQALEIANFKELITEQDLLAATLKDIVVEYATIDVSDKKQVRSFWAKVGKRLTELIEYSTRPETVQSVATILILTRAIKQK